MSGTVPIQSSVLITLNQQLYRVTTTQGNTVVDLTKMPPAQKDNLQKKIQSIVTSILAGQQAAQNQELAYEYTFTASQIHLKQKETDAAASPLNQVPATYATTWEEIAQVISGIARPEPPEPLQLHVQAMPLSQAGATPPSSSTPARTQTPPKEPPPVLPPVVSRAVHRLTGSDNPSNTPPQAERLQHSTGRFTAWFAGGRFAEKKPQQPENQPPKRVEGGNTRLRQRNRSPVTPPPAAPAAGAENQDPPAN